MNSERIAGTGIWSAPLRYGDAAETAEAAAELESLGYTALWVPDLGGDLFGDVARLLRATTDTVVATGILNLWLHDPAEVAADFHRLVDEHGRRLIVGIGVSHAAFVEATGRSYERPLTRMQGFLDALDEADEPLPVTGRLLAALGPKMLHLAGTRSAGTHTYLVTPEHTASTRAVLGPEPLIAAEQAVVLETDARRARDIGRTHLAVYLGLPNYANNWKRIGLTEDDLTGGGSDRLVDALIAWGDEDQIAARVGQHRDAGADHVCVQVLDSDLLSFPRQQWRRLAPALVPAG